MTKIEFENQQNSTDPIQPQVQPIISQDMIDNPAALPYVKNASEQTHPKQPTITGTILIASSLFFTGMGVYVRYSSPNDVSGLSEVVGNIWIGLGVIFIIASLIIYRFIKKWQSSNN
jgi:hypothetical protein